MLSMLNELDLDQYPTWSFISTKFEENLMISSKIYIFVDFTSLSVQLKVFDCTLTYGTINM